MSDELKVSDPDCNLVNVFAMINRVDEKINNFDKKLAAHMHDEAQQYKRLEQKIDRLSEAVESLAVLHTAFPLNEDGTAPDLEDHHTFHMVQRKGYKESVNRKQRLKEMLIDKAVNVAVLSIGVLLVLGAHTWVSSWLGIK